MGKSDGVNNAIASMSRVLAEKVTASLKIPENRAEFEKWYLERYGVPYQWKHN